MELRYNISTGRVVSALKRIGEVSRNISLNYISSMPQTLVKMPNSSIIYASPNMFESGIKIKVDNEEGLDEVRELMKKSKLPLYDGLDSLVEPTNHLGWNPISLPRELERALSYEEEEF
jgi:hypothetical protein